MLIWDVSYLQHGTISPYADQFAQWLCNAKQYFLDEEQEESGLPLAADLSTAEMLLYSHKGKEKDTHTGLGEVLPSLISAPPSVTGQFHIDSISMPCFKHLI